MSHLPHQTNPLHFTSQLDHLHSFVICVLLFSTCVYPGHKKSEPVGGANKQTPRHIDSCVYWTPPQLFTLGVAWHTCGLLAHTHSLETIGPHIFKLLLGVGIVRLDSGSAMLGIIHYWYAFTVYLQPWITIALLFVAMSVKLAITVPLFFAGIPV